MDQFGIEGSNHLCVGPGAACKNIKIHAVVYQDLLKIKFGSLLDIIESVFTRVHADNRDRDKGWDIIACLAREVSSHLPEVG